MVVTNKVRQPRRNLVPHATKAIKLLVLRSCSGILEAVMEALSAAREEWAGFLCVVTDGDHVIKLLARELIHRLRPMLRDVDADL